MGKQTSLTAWVLLIVLSIIWGSSFILIKRGLDGLTPWELGSVRILAAWLCLLPFAVLRLRRVAKNQWPYLLSVGFLGSLVPGFLFAIAQTKLESSVTGVLNALTPIFTILVGLIFYHQKQSPRVFIGVLVGFTGTTILALANSSGAFAINGYVFFVMLATLCYGTNLNIIKYHLSNLQALTVTSISLLFAGPVGLVYILGFTNLPTTFLESSDVQLAVGYTALLGMMATAIALILFNKLVQITEPVFAASVTYLIPIVAIIWGLIDGEILLPMHYLGMVAIVVGVYVTNRVKESK